VALHAQQAVGPQGTSAGVTAPVTLWRRRRRRRRTLSS